MCDLGHPIVDKPVVIQACNLCGWDPEDVSLFRTYSYGEKQMAFDHESCRLREALVLSIGAGLQLQLLDF